MKTGVRAEVVNGRPQIIVLYDMLDKGTAMAISYMGYKKVSGRRSLYITRKQIQTYTVTLKQVCALCMLK